MNDHNRSALRYKTPFLVFACVISLVAGIVIGRSTVRSAARTTGTSSTIIDEIHQIIEHNWVDTTESKETIMNRMASGAVGGLGDPHTSYMTAQETAEYNKTIDGRYVGLGVNFMVVGEGAMVTRVFADTPAAKAGLKIGDILYEVNGQSLKGMDSQTLRTAILKTAQTMVTKIIRDGKQISKTIIKGDFTADAYYGILQGKSKLFGYLELETFGDGTAAKVEDALKYFTSQQIDTIVIDLRDNGGGYLEAVKKILSLFIKKNDVIFSMRRKGESEVQTRSTGSTQYAFEKGYILINQNTASASELMAGALSECLDYQLVGVKSYGKGTAQTQTRLSDSSVLKYTYALWYTPEGRNINGKGFTPDIKVKETPAITTAYTTVKKAIKLETVSEEAACMQVMLKTLGYEPGRTDGYFSKKTLTALKAFLKAEKMSDSQVYNQAICTRLLAAYIKYVKVLDHDPVYKHVISLI